MGETTLQPFQIESTYPSFKNAIINGDMLIAQRGTSFAAVANEDYTIDRWEYAKATTTAVHTISQSTDTPNDQFGYSLKMDCTTADASVAAGDVAFLRQKIEGYNFRKFIGQTATLSFWVKAGKTGTMCVAFRSSGADRSYVSDVPIDSANTWEKKTVTLDFDYSGGTWNYTNGIGLQVTFTVIAGTTFQTTANTWQTGNYVATSNQTNFCDATDATCDVFITGVQFEIGGAASDFEFVDYGTQLFQCYRYYYRHVSGVAYKLYGMAQGDGPAAAYAHYEFPVELRSGPSAAFSAAGDFALYRLGTGNITVTGLTPSNLSNNGCQLFITTGSAAILDNDCLMFRSNNTTTAWLAFDAEL